MGILKALYGDKPIGRAKRDLKAGEVIEFRICGMVLESEAIEFFNPNYVALFSLQSSFIKEVSIKES